MSRRVPFTGAEKESLLTSLDRHRHAVLWKLEGRHRARADRRHDRRSQPSLKSDPRRLALKDVLREQRRDHVIRYVDDVAYSQINCHAGYDVSLLATEPALLQQVEHIQQRVPTS